MTLNYVIEIVYIRNVGITKKAKHGFQDTPGTAFLM